MPDIDALSPKRFSARTSPDEITAFVELLRPLLRRVIAVFQGKGGQGKTSLATHTAALLAEGEVAKAEAGEPAGRVLLLEIDMQGNTHLDLGTEAHPLNDHGESLAMAIQYNTDLRIIKDVRPRLDLVPSGRELENLPALMFATQQKRGRAAWLGLAVVLAKLAETYAWVVIDCPPVTKEPQELALAAARYVLSPVAVGDSGSVDGLGGVAHRFESTADLNPDLELLGAVLFDFEHKYYTNPRSGERRAVGAWVEVRTGLEKLLASAGADAPVFQSVIRSAESVARACRARGQLTFEVAESTDGIKWWQKRAGQPGPVLPTNRAEQVGQDYEDLVFEVVQRILAIEATETTT